LAWSRAADLVPPGSALSFTATYAGETLLGIQGDPGREMSFNVVFLNIAQVLATDCCDPPPRLSSGS